MNPTVEQTDTTNDLLSPKPDRQWTDLSCHTPETAAAVYKYLNDEIAQQEERPNIEARIEKATVRISYVDCRDREAWDMQLVGYRDGVEYAANHAAALQAQLDALKIMLERESRDMQKWNNRANHLAIEGQELRARLAEVERERDDLRERCDVYAKTLAGHWEECEGEAFRRQAIEAVREAGWLHPHDREGVVSLLETLAREERREWLRS